MQNEIQRRIREELSEAYLKILLPIMTLFIPLFAFSNIYPTLLWGPLSITVLLSLSILAGWILKLRGRHYLASTITSISIYCTALIGVIANGGVNAPAYVGAFVPITFFAWLTTKRAVTLPTVILIVTGFLRVLYNRAHPEIYLPEYHDLSY